jgi:2-polyprenyl-3-methyl-5-hydroxy-6-metoxy-1,4-benzoquinol methylase
MQLTRPKCQTSSKHPYDDASRSEMLGLIPSTAGRLLDVGCSWGAFGEALMRERPRLQVFGIDSSLEAVEVARNRLVKVVHGQFPDDLPDDWRSFECITFNDSLEHLVDPWEALRICKDRLAVTGVVVASIPNVRWLPISLGLLRKGTWRYETTGILDRTHLRFFTRSGIETLFTDVGYEIRQLYPWNRVLPTRSTRILAMCGHRYDDLLSMHFAVVAAPVRQ